jgi:hypothetical protein
VSCAALLVSGSRSLLVGLLVAGCVLVGWFFRYAARTVWLRTMGRLCAHGFLTILLLGGLVVVPLIPRGWVGILDVWRARAQIQDPASRSRMALWDALTKKIQEHPVMGFGFGIVVMRMVVTMFYQKSVELQIGNILDISLLLSQIMMTSTLMGAAFQFPIVLTVLIRLKVVTYHQIESKRIIAYIASLIFAILLPPTDLLSMFLLFLPLALLFELTLILNRWVLKAHRR